MGNQDLFVVIVLTDFIFVIIYIIKHPTNKSSSSGSGKLMEADNVGMRCDTAIDGEAYFLPLFQKEPKPIIFYLFNNKDKAIQALAEVSCITIAEDSRKLSLRRNNIHVLHELLDIIKKRKPEVF